MLEGISYYPIFGLPLIVYLGLSTLILMIFTASIAIMNRRGIHRIPFLWHPRMAKVTITIALIHGTLALLVYI